MQKSPTPATSFGDLLKQHRLRSGESQEALAERARISASAVGALERGARLAPYRETVVLLADALGLSVGERVELESAAERARGRRPRGSDKLGRSTLPTRLTSFVGREKEIETIETLLGAHRLVTVTGSGGVGKTRVAVEVARRFDARGGETYFVDLSHVNDGSFVAGALASVLGIVLPNPGDSLKSLAAALKMREMLLLVDNCEHVIFDAAKAVTVLLRHCQRIVILATSRERLGIEGERLYRLPSLEVPATAPDTEDGALTYAAFRLFMERANSIESGIVFTGDRLGAVAEICRRLEGIPLAIELAATRLPSLGFAALNQRLKEHLVIASGARDVPQRQRTMLATIVWSYDLLSEQERTLFRRMANFRGGATLEAAEKVCADHRLPAKIVADVLASLVDKSLVNVTLEGRHGRYMMLESVRTFASSKLAEAGEIAFVAKAHARWLATLSERAEERYSQNARSRSMWLDEFGDEIDNARAAIDWALGSDDDDARVLAGSIVGGLRGLWISTNRYFEYRRLADAALKRLDIDRHPLVASRVMRGQLQAAEGSAVFPIATRAIPVFERIGHRRALISLHAQIALRCGLSGAFTEADNSIREAFGLAKDEHLESTRQYAELLQVRCCIRAHANRLQEAKHDFLEAANLRATIGEEDAVTELHWEALFAFVDGKVRDSVEFLQRCADEALSESISPAEPLADLAAARLVLGEIDGAETAAREAFELMRFAQLDYAWRALQHLATVATLRSRPLVAARLLGFVDTWCSQKGRIRGVFEHAGHRILMASLRDRLSGDTIAMLVAEGSLYDFELAVDNALDVPRGSSGLSSLIPREDILMTYPMPMGKWCEDE
jgi:predicted ATPase/DNA-binding XRE family transcriptional regulator